MICNFLFFAAETNMTAEANDPVIAREPRITVYTMVTVVASRPPVPPRELGLHLRVLAGARVRMRVVTNPALRPSVRQEIHSVIPARANTRMSATSETL